MVVHIQESDVGKRIEIKYKSSLKRVTGKIITVTARMVGVLTDTDAMHYFSIAKLEKDQCIVRIH